MTLRSLPIIAAALSIGATALPGSADAALLQFELSATVVDASASFASNGVTPGAVFTGTYTIDTTLPDLRPDDPGFSFYSGVVVSLRFSVGDVVVEIPSPMFSSSSIRIFDRSPGGRDIFDFRAAANSNIAELGRIDFFVSLADETGTVLSDDSIPTPFPAFSEFSTDSAFTYLGVLSEDGGKAFLSIDSHVQVVPVPPAALLFLSSLFGIVLSRTARS